MSKGLFIANLFLERTKGPESHKYKKFGCLWWDTERQNASVRLTGFPVGGCTFAGRPFPSVIESPMDVPYVSGDIKMKVGAYTKDGVTKNEYQWLGHIQSQQDEQGNTIYVGAIEVVPVFSPLDRGGVFAPIFAEDYKAPEPPKEEDEKQDEVMEGEEDDLDNLPF